MSTIRPEGPERYFLPTAVLELKRQIKDHGGNEVFFVGHPGDTTGKIQAIEALARGNKDRVPAILDAARSGDVVIHNHPSGELVPSDADLELASHFGNCAVGFLIVNNGVNQVVAVVRPFVATVRQVVPETELVRRLGPESELAKAMPGYEWRPGQLQMANSVLGAFNQDGISVVEAGTGTGKSLAYLLPAALSAIANREVLVVATHTINLQEQLYSKDVPRVAQLEGVTGLKFALLKGRSNYLCNRKLEYFAQQPGELFDADSATTLSQMLNWYKTTATGTRSELNFPLAEEIWERVSASEEDCTKVKCANYDNCFYYHARRQAAGAHVIIVNQHLLLADLALRHAAGDYKRALVLPPYRRVILDEAHHLEEVATSFSSHRFGMRGIGKTLGRLYVRRVARRQKESEEARGILVLLLTRLVPLESNAQEPVHRIQLHVTQTLQPRIEALRKVAKDYLGEMAFQLAIELEDKGAQSYRRVTLAFTQTPFWTEVVCSRVEELALLTSSLGDELTSLIAILSDLPESFQQQEQQIGLELAMLTSRLQGYTENLRTFLRSDANKVRWFELERPSQGELSAVICTAPIEVAELLRDSLFEPLKTVVLTSATLSVAGKFDYLRDRVGLRGVKRHTVETLAVASPFDFAQQVLLGIPRDFPEPRDALYTERLIEMVESAVLRSGGGAFVLFTSYQLLNTVYTAILRRGTVRVPLLKHGDGPRNALLERFRQSNNAVLFGTDSFWEGVDVQGDALRLVIITRLPFQVPSEPIQEARAERIVENGRDPFQEISMPQAVIRFKQGFGRLIRHRDDRGVVLVLDQRIIGKYYGRYFLESLPGVRPTVGKCEDILSTMEAFFRRERGTGGTVPGQGVSTR